MWCTAILWHVTILWCHKTRSGACGMQTAALTARSVVVMQQAALSACIILNGTKILACSWECSEQL
jgi:hypothetical protein